MSVEPSGSVWEEENTNPGKIHRAFGRSVWDDENDSTSEKPQPSNQSIWKPFLVSLLITVIIGTIVIAAMITSWILVTYINLWHGKYAVLFFPGGDGGTTSNTTTTRPFTTFTTSFTTVCSTTAITTTVTSAPLPSQCSSYTIITDPTRHASYTSGNTCDDSIFSSPQWVRFSGTSGTMLANCPVTDYRCNTLASGWYSGIYPSTAGTTTSGNVCFNFLGNTCNWPNSISITNCNGYYVFYLSAPTCISRYCTI